MNNPRKPTEAEQEGLLACAFCHDGAAQSLLEANLHQQAFPDALYYALYITVCQEQARHMSQRLSSLQVRELAVSVIRQLTQKSSEDAAAVWDQIVSRVVHRDDVHPLVARLKAWAEYALLKEEAKIIAQMSLAVSAGQLTMADYAQAQRMHADHASRVAAFQPGVDAARLDALFERSLATDDTVPTGFPEWDNLISLSYPGGLALGSLNTIAGDTGNGKTTMMMGLLRGLLVAPSKERKVATVYLNFEVAEHEFLRSLFGVFMGIHPLVAERKYDCRSPEGRKWLSAQWTEFRRLLGQYVGDCLIDFRRCQSYRVDDMEHFIRLRAGDGFQVFVIDTINRIQDEAARQSRHEEIQSVVYKLERLAHDLNVCIVLAAQHNREKQSRRDKRPLLQDIAGSQAIEHSSHSVSQLYRADVHDDADWVELHVTKSRARGVQRNRVVRLRYCEDKRIYVPVHEAGPAMQVA